jgi:2-keto-4-pentenoate hydratase/2-oxohepta-3-ene-1,7-dioic acid hydratase in catechol pathway
MRFATYFANGRNQYGFLLSHPATNKDWIFNPSQTQKLLQQYAAVPSSPYALNVPRFLGTWPETLVEFLGLGAVGMSAAQSMQEFVQRFLEQSDQALLSGAGFPREEVALCSPIPYPRLCFGLVDNKPKRYAPDRPIWNIYPQGHQRPLGSILNPGEPLVITPEMKQFRWNPELGIIIGQGGKNINYEDAMSHVAGYTVVIDISHDHYLDQIRAEAGLDLDFFAAATGSWLGKKSDTLCPVGPYLTTPDEVGSPYDLLIYSRQSGLTRDRAHSGAALVGIEETISYLSSFMELHPGDIIHMATMGVDGLLFPDRAGFGPDDYIEGEIEKVGRLRVPVVLTEEDDWRSKESPGRKVHPAPVVRDLVGVEETTISSTTDWSPQQARHVWTSYCNTRNGREKECTGERSLPSVINSPGSVLASSGQTVVIPSRAQTVHVGVELAFVIKQFAYRVSEAEADEFILGYTPLMVLHDDSFADQVVEPATIQERSVPIVYARWADGFNVIGMPVTVATGDLDDQTMQIWQDDQAPISTNIAGYIHGPAAVLSFVSQNITLFPGDVVTLGRNGPLLTLSNDGRLPVGTTIQGSIEGIGDVTAVLDDRRPGLSV